MSLFRLLRISVLLTVLLIVAGNHWLGQSRLSGWDRPLWITLYPVLADGEAETREYLQSLTARGFSELGQFLSRESTRFGKLLNTPVEIQLAPALEMLPPPIPDTDNRLAIAWWSLKMRWWAWRRGAQDGLPEPDIQMFVLFRQGQESVALDRSVGIQAGRYAVVNAFASRQQASRNSVVIMHELLHVLGATDKYDLHTGVPIVPQGLADPDRQPLFPQSVAEIMGGRIALSPDSARMPSSLRECVVGPESAREIGW